jgi:hypothetical protein
LSEDQKDVGLSLLFSLSESLPDNSLFPVLAHLLPILSNSLTAAQSLKVRTSAVHAFYGVTGHVEESHKKERESLQALVVRP